MSHTVTITNLGLPTASARAADDLVFSKGQRDLLLVVSVLLVLSSPFWLGALFFSGPYEYAIALILVPMICLANLGSIARLTRHRPGLRQLMILSFTTKIACTGAYTALLYIYYGNGADATTYFDLGKKWAAFFSVHGSFPVQGSVWGTSFINLLTGFLVSVLGSSFPAISVLYAAAGFWGIYFFYRAFVEAFPNTRKEFAALLLFLLPSCQFWTAGIGKDALMMLSIGVAAFGFTQLMASRIVRGFAYVGPAMLLAAFTRPHVAGMVAIAMLFPYTFAKGRHGVVSALSKVIGIPAMAAGVAYLVTNASRLLNVDSAVGGVQRIEKLGVDTMHGGSAFGSGQSVAVKLLLSPFLMFRPFPWELPNALALAAIVEGLFLFYFLWRARHAVIEQLLNWRSHPFFTFAVSFGIIYCLVFSLALSNLGLLIRQRTQYTPLLLILIASSPLLPQIRKRFR